MRVGVKTYLNLQPSICIHDSSYYGHHSSLTDICDKLLFNSDTKIRATLLICNLDVVTNVVIITHILILRGFSTFMERKELKIDVYVSTKEM